jgi:hypothetical protein
MPQRPGRVSVSFPPFRRTIIDIEILELERGKLKQTQVSNQTKKNGMLVS